MIKGQLELLFLYLCINIIVSVLDITYSLTRIYNEHIVNLGLVLVLEILDTKPKPNH